MEFDFYIHFQGEKHIVAWDAKRISHLKPEDQRNLEKLLEEFGKKSAVAQALQAPVTDIHRLRSTDQRLYLYMYRQSSKTVVLGGLKVGTKRLFVRTANTELREIEPMCVLDFYVHESCQRQGVGKAIFEHFLQTEGWDPSCLAYDRPSPKLLAFLKRHYGLHEYVPQSNNFVVFNRYFELNPANASGSRAGGSQARLASRGSTTAVAVAAPHLPGPRTPPPPPGSSSPPPPVHPGWGPHPIAVPSPSSAGPPPPLGQSPSLGRRWAASTFGPQAPPFPAAASGPVHPLGHEASSSGGGGGGAEAGYGPGDSLDAFSREHTSQAPHTSPPHLRPAPWEGTGGCAGPGPGGQPPASRSGYSSRPPWAVDAEPEPAGASGAGYSHGGMTCGASYAGTPSRPPLTGGVPPRSPLLAMLGGGGGGGGGGAGGEGPHTRALQQQLAAMSADAAGPGAAGRGLDSGARGATPLGSGRLGTGAGDPGSAGRGTARMMAVAQRSGAGAADCLVW